MNLGRINLGKTLFEPSLGQSLIPTNTQGLVVSDVATKMRLATDLARRYRYLPASDSLFEVKSNVTLGKYIVDLEKKTCSCRAWQLQGFPCAHAISVILGRCEDPQLYVDKCFSLDAYRLTYCNTIFPS
jgi:SWIM zinc finger